MTIPAVTSEMFDFRSASSEDKGCDIHQLAERIGAKSRLHTKAKIAKFGE